ncbi:Helix-turn-helix domain protein [Gimesia alba]|uniref:Helix-turn-helix domain protein n=1 Tax=Gimesia alba TaxID=2527973 RepID=A0A517RMT9_9PLAN|nr:helix-turn-helix transcriptional regulator [Gimesia alba]QDT45193.1 Helix-turn-helix domain protein [Gimesia alba]
MKKTRYSQKYSQLLKALKEARIEAGLTQTTVGNKFGAHASFVSKCESGERRIDVIELASFCKIYNVPLTEFLQRIEL